MPAQNQRFGRHARLSLLCLCAAIVSPSTSATAQNTSAFERAYTAFVRTCIASAPSFRGVPRAARAFGIDRFTFAPSEQGSSEFGMHHGYNFDVAPDNVGYALPRGQDQLAISYTTKLRQIDRMCVITYGEPFDGLTGVQAEQVFFASLRARAGGENLRERGPVLTQAVDGFDYEYSVTTSGGLVYLYLHVWE